MEKNILCPKCKSKGIEVKSITVKHLVNDEFAKEVKEHTYFVCMDEGCDTVYFSPDLEISYSKEQIKVPIWFKREANPKYICYCNKVTEQDIINAVINDGAKDMKDIIRLTGVMKNGKCDINNPLGRCCGQIIQETINKALELKASLWCNNKL